MLAAFPRAWKTPPLLDKSARESQRLCRLKPAKPSAKDVYQQLRTFSPEQLWKNEVPRLEQAQGRERSDLAGVVRAVGVVFLEKGNEAEKAEAKAWLRGLLHDSDEKVRRYAAAALPKLGSGPLEEAALIGLLERSASPLEKKHVAEALAKIGGAAALPVAKSAGPVIEQKVKASVSRTEAPSVLRFDRPLEKYHGVQIHLRGRAGLEKIVREEAGEFIAKNGRFVLADETEEGVVTLEPEAPFTLGELYRLRCFGTLGFSLGRAEEGGVHELARIVTSPLAHRILSAFTDGSLRYRLEFIGKGHQRGAVRALAARSYQLHPGILNDARNAPWTVNIYSAPDGQQVELAPRATPDPRFIYRQGDVPAASHPPLAAVLARVAGRVEGDVVWDPFCGSGLELIERALLGGVAELHGTDLSAEAIAVARRNLEAAELGQWAVHLEEADFRSYGEALGKERVSLIITNPPMGKRVPIRDLRSLIADLLATAQRTLRPGGRLVFPNPMPAAKTRPAGLELKSSTAVDMGGFECRLELYVKASR